MLKDYVEITFTNGDVFHVPSEVVALDRTKYYAGVDGYEEGSEEWIEEFNNSMRCEIHEWMTSNMNWSDIKDHAVLQPKESKEYDYESHWNEIDISHIVKEA